jgi:hypothetical protein
MFNGQAASDVDHCEDRPKYVRYSSDPYSCHPLQAKRSSSGNTDGVVYISVEDNKHVLESRCRKSTNSVATSPLSLPVLEDSLQQADPAPLHHDGATHDKDNIAQIQFPDALPNPGSCLVHTDNEKVPQTAITPIGSIHSTVASSSSLALDHIGALLRPHYASSVSLKAEPESYLLNDKDRSVSVPYLGRLKRNSVSMPHDEGEHHGQSREGSTSSISSYLRANAFLGHRDTLARIKHAPNTTGSSSASLAQYPSYAIPSIPSSLLARHRDTFARISYKRRPALPLPKAVFRRLLQYLTFDEYKALRLTSRAWLPSLPLPHLPASYRIPSEILQEVYNSLSPIDFDAARHTCKSWFVASLDRRLLVTMSRRAGCYGSIQADLHLRQDHYDEKRQSLTGRMWANHDDTEIDDCHQPEMDHVVSEEWVYSKRLAIESMLSPDWRGISLKHNSENPTDASARMTSIGSVGISLVSQPHSRPIDAPSAISGNAYTVSGCSKFVLITSGRVVFVCELLRRKPGIQPLTRIVCPRKVLRVSMDTSSKRYAVAMLLEGRVGMCCNLTDGFGDPSSTAATQGDSMQLGMSAEVRGSNSVAATTTPTVSALPLRRAELSSSIPGGQFYVRSASEAFISPASNTIAESGPDNSWFDDTLNRYHLREEPADGEQEAVSKIGVPIENGPRTVYNNLCSFDDPPRSVAICPQRRCVAFGCRMGIELHWVDSLTGSDLSRWFPLAAPSDFLYFLPTRSGMDSAKKLRLISSAARPYAQQQTTTSLRGSPPSKLNWRTSPNGSRRPSMTRLFFGNLPFPTTTTMYGIPVNEQSENTSIVDAERDHGILRTVDCDHYRAVPLSDGAHLLFTDPETSHLCLGSDAPLGGPTKLLRKVLCLPPDIEDTGPKPEENELPEQNPNRPWLMCYTPGQDLRWGVRIAAAYSDGRIMLYCVPADIFERMRHIKTGIDVWDERAGIVGQSDLLMDILMQQDVVHGNASTASYAANEAGAHAEGSTDFSEARSLSLHGVEVGKVSGPAVEDIAVSCDFGGVRVWIFLQNGLVRMWTLFRTVSGREEKWVIGKDGIVRNKEEARIYKESVSPTTTTQVSRKTGKGDEGSKSEGQERDKQHIRFAGSGLDGAADDDTDHQGPVKQVTPSNIPPDETKSLGIPFLSLCQRVRNPEMVLRLFLPGIRAGRRPRSISDYSSA